MDALRKLVLSLVLIAGLLTLCGCSGGPGKSFSGFRWFVPVAQTNGAPLQPNPDAVGAIHQIGSLFGPIGDVAAGAAGLVLLGVSNAINKRRLNKHLEEYHGSIPKAPESSS